MADLAGEYLAWLEQSDRAASTQETARWCITGYLLPWFGAEREARTIRPRDVETFIEDVAAGRYRPPGGRARRTGDGRPSAATCNRVLVALRVLLGWGAERQLLPSNPAASVKARRERNAAVFRALTDTELSAWLAELADEPAAALWVRWAQATGMRAGEIRALQWSDVDRVHRHARVRADVAKGRTARLVPLTADALEVAAELAGNAVCVGAVFGRASHRRALASAWRRTGLPGRAPTPHDLRHTAASRAAAAGAGLGELMAWFGWQDASTAARYLDAYGDRLAALARRMDGD